MWAYKFAKIVKYVINRAQKKEHRMLFYSVHPMYNCFLDDIGCTKSKQFLLLHFRAMVINPLQASRVIGSQMWPMHHFRIVHTWTPGGQNNVFSQSGSKWFVLNDAPLSSLSFYYNFAFTNIT